MEALLETISLLLPSVQIIVYLFTCCWSISLPVTGVYFPSWVYSPPEGVVVSRVSSWWTLLCASPALTLFCRGKVQSRRNTADGVYTPQMNIRSLSNVVQRDVSVIVNCSRCGFALSCCWYVRRFDGKEKLLVPHTQHWSPLAEVRSLRFRLRAGSGQRLVQIGLFCALDLILKPSDSIWICFGMHVVPLWLDCTHCHWIWYAHATIRTA